MAVSKSGIKGLRFYHEVYFYASVQWKTQSFFPLKSNICTYLSLFLGIRKILFQNYGYL